MPFYDYKCKDCNGVEEHLRSIEERNEAPDCHCGGEMELRIASPAFKIDNTFQERLNRNYDKHKEDVRRGDAEPNSIDRYKGNIG